MDEPKQLPGPTMPDRADEAPKVALTRDQLEAQLLERRASMQARIDALQDEVESTGLALHDAVERRPFAAVGASVAAGLVVGLLFGGRRHRRKGAASHRALIEQYIDTLVAEVRHAVARGKDADKAVAAALKNRVPLIVFSPRDGARPGLLRDVYAMMLQTALGFGLKAAADFITHRLTPVEVQEERTVEQRTDDGEWTKTTVSRTVSGTPEG
jgi:ElaB/YqjD/DUF883 family membrane-anchored ribosome-binding protein